MRKRYRVFIIAIALLFFGCNIDKEYVEKRDKEKRKYKVVTNFDHQPLMYKDYNTGEKKGFVYEIAKEIEKRGEFTFVWEEISIAKIFDEVSVGNYDIGVAPFISTEDRKKKVNLTEIFHTSNILVLGNKNINYNKNVKYIYGVQAESEVVNRIDNENNSKIIVSSKEERLVESLLNKDIDYIVIDDVCGNEILKNNSQLFQKEIMEKTSVSLITSKTMDKDDFKKINSIILEMKADGTIEKLRKKYDM